jgi:hypothetical protein
MTGSDRTTWLAGQLAARDPALAALVEQLMPSMSGAESAHRRALLDGYLAVLAAESAGKHAAAAKSAANGLTLATWALVFVTVVLVLVTLVVGLK